MSILLSLGYPLHKLSFKSPDFISNRCQAILLSLGNSAFEVLQSELLTF